MLFRSGKPTNPENVPQGQTCEVVGAVSSSKGVTFTPGNAAEGSWQSLGTTTKDNWAFYLGVGYGNSAATASVTAIDLAFGDATNKTMLIENYFANLASTENIACFGIEMLAPIYKYVPSGSTLYIRGQGTAAATGTWNANVLCIGG